MMTVKSLDCEMPFAPNKLSFWFYASSMKLTPGRRFETAVPDDVMMTAGL